MKTGFNGAGGVGYIEHAPVLAYQRDIAAVGLDRLSVHGEKLPEAGNLPVALVAGATNDSGVLAEALAGAVLSPGRRLPVIARSLRDAAGGGDEQRDGQRAGV